MLTLGARLAFGLSSTVLPVSGAALLAVLLAVLLATFLATARGFFTGASPALSADWLLRGRADLTAVAESVATVPLSVSALRFRGALAGTGD